MPARTNVRQAVIYFVKQHRAPPGATVTESEFLLDSEQGTGREVDVVVRGQVGDDPIVIGVEVRDRKRPADVSWAEGLIMKHSHMPTNRLLLVSWSGFSKGALAKVEAQGGWVEAITPDRTDEVDVQVKIIQEVRTIPTRIALLVRDGDEQRWMGDVPRQGALFARDSGEEVGTVATLIHKLSKGTGEQLSKDVYHHEERDSLTHYSFKNEMLEPVGLCVDVEGDRLAVLGIEVIGELLVGGHELSWEFWHLGPALFAMTRVDMRVGPMLYVLSPKEDGSESISWRPIP